MQLNSKVSWGVSISVLIALIFYVPEAQAAGGVVINELMWDGTEYVELFNTTSDGISLSGWQLTRQQASGTEKIMVTFDAGNVIGAGEYYLLEKKEDATTIVANKIVSGLTLVNTGELVRLKDSGGGIVDGANQLDDWFAGSNVGEGEAMERSDAASDGTNEDSWHTSLGSVGGRIGTPGEINSVVPENAAPAAALSMAGDEAAVNEIVTFSAEDSSDPDGDTLTYQWDFGDGTTSAGSTATHAYTSAGTKTVRVTVRDGELPDTATGQITVVAPVYSSDIFINEFLPDPTGSDTASEFIELFNTGSVLVDVSSWKLDDADGGSSPYTFPAGTTIPAGGYAALTRSVTKIALNNDGDSVRLLDPTGRVKSSQSYDSSSEGKSWNRTDANSFQESTTTTSGAQNIITEPPAETEAEEGRTGPAPKPTPRRPAQRDSAGLVAGATTRTIALKNIRQEDEGAVVTVEGVVSAPPEVLGKGIVYLAGSGVQLYLSDEDFPDLVLGDTLKVIGEIGSYLGETRLKLASAKDVTKIKTVEAPLPHAVKTGEVGEDFEGFLVVVAGKVTETSGDTFYVDDGSGEVKVFIKESTEIEKPKMKKGDLVTITGVVSQTTSGYRVLPRFQEDVRLGAVAGLKTFPATGVTQQVAWSGRTLVLVLAALWLPALTWRSRV